MFDRILKSWEKILEGQLTQPWAKVLQGPDLKVEHYKGYLLETYHYTRINPQLQAASSIFFPSNKYKFLSKYLAHAADEISHDSLALTDLVKLGESRERLIETKPLPLTRAFMSLPFYQIFYVSPISYLAQIFMLEILATQKGQMIMSSLDRLNLPKNSTMFLKEHAEVDVEHNTAMEFYVAEFVKTEEDFNIFMDGMKTSSDVFFKMIEAGMLNGPKFFNDFN